MSIGQIIGPVLSGILLDIYGIGAVFYFSGIVSIISVLAFWLFSGSIVSGTLIHTNVEKY